MLEYDEINDFSDDMVQNEDCTDCISIFFNYYHTAGIIEELHNKNWGGQIKFTGDASLELI